MNKINFENLPSDNTPISAENLNLMQENIEAEIINTITNSENTSTAKAYSCNYMNDNYIKVSDWKQPQYHSFYAQAGNEYSITFNIKPSSMNWNYDLYKISMFLGEANWYTIKDVFVGVGLHDWGDYQASVIKQVLILEEDFIEIMSIQNNRDNTVTIKFKSTISAKLKIRIEPYGIYL